MKRFVKHCSIAHGLLPLKFGIISEL
jgi:hypothetical protein